MQLRGKLPIYGFSGDEAVTRYDRPRTVCVIHSCELKIWKDSPSSGKLLELHEQFLKQNKKNRITRILCGREAVPNDNFREVYEKMKKKRIDVKYYDIESTMVTHDFTWDFLLVRETDVAVIWESYAAGGQIGTATYTSSGEFDSKSLVSLWDEIDAHSQRFEEYFPEGNGGL